MNIFILDHNLDKSVEYHVDKHVVKMPLEAAQMLCANYWITSQLGPTPRKITSEEKARLEPTKEFYGISHYNHPCTVWARSSQQAHEYLMCYAYALNDEYGYRYNKSHKSIEVINRLPELQYPGLYTPPPQAMPDEYKRLDPVDAYRAYYVGAKSHLAAWKFREPPPWYYIPEIN